MNIDYINKYKKIQNNVRVVLIVIKKANLFLLVIKNIFLGKSFRSRSKLWFDFFHSFNMKNKNWIALFLMKEKIFRFKNVKSGNIFILFFVFGHLDNFYKKNLFLIVLNIIIYLFLMLFI